MSEYISIVCPVKNREGLLKETVASVLAQTSDRWELILVDDYSSTHCRHLLDEISYKNPKIKVFHKSSEKEGACSSRNIGLRLCNYNWVVFLDSDDIIGPSFVKTRVAAILEKQILDMLIYPVVSFNQKPGDSSILWNTFSGNDDLDRFLNSDPVWHTTSPVWKKSSLLKIGGFNESLTCWQDWEIHCKALLLGLTYEKLKAEDLDIFYRRHDKGAISDQEDVLAYQKGKFKAIESIFCLVLDRGQPNERINFLFAKLIFSIITVLDSLNYQEKEFYDELVCFLKSRGILSETHLKLWEWRNKKSSYYFGTLLRKAFDKWVIQYYGQHFLERSKTYLKSTSLR